MIYGNGIDALHTSPCVFHSVHADALYIDVTVTDTRYTYVHTSNNRRVPVKKKLDRKLFCGLYFP